MSYISFKRLRAKLAKKPGITNPDALTASIMRKKYKKKDILKHQQSGTSMRNVKPKKTYG